MPHARAVARASALWLFSATVAFSLVLSFEAFRRVGTISLAGEIGYLGRIALLTTLVSSVAIAALHGIRLAFGERRVLGALATSAMVAAFSLVPGWRIASLLTSGSYAAEMEQRAAFRVAFAAAFVVGHVGLWLFHLLGTVGVAHWKPRRIGLAAHVALGLLGLVPLVHALNFSLGAYAYVAEALVRPTWLLGATLLYVALDRARLAPRSAMALAAAALLAVVALNLLAPEAVARSRAGYMKRGRLVGLADSVSRPWRRIDAAIRLDDTDGLNCAPHPEARTLPDPSSPSERRRNVILVSIDALRRDAMTWRWKNRPVMPNLERFAQGSVDFRRAVTTYPATLLAVGGALTGLDASLIYFSPNTPPNVFALGAEVFDRRLAIMPRTRWFKTAAVKDLLLQGASVVWHKNARDGTSKLIRELKDARQSGQRVLAWLHYYEPHAPYQAHEGFDFGGGRKGGYRSELSYVDARMSELFAYLEEEGFFDDSLVVVFSDHGQALGENDYFGHHVYLNSWIADVPLILRAPGVKPARVDDVVDLTDVAVTAMHFSGVPVPWGTVGESLLAPDRRPGRISFGEAFPVRGMNLFRAVGKRTDSLATLRERLSEIQTVVKDYQPKVSAVSATHRLIVNRATGLEEFYDRRADPGEVQDLGEADSAEQRRLRDELEAWTARQAEKLYCRVRRREEPARGATAPPAPPEPE